MYVVNINNGQLDIIIHYPRINAVKEQLFLIQGACVLCARDSKRMRYLCMTSAYFASLWADKRKVVGETGYAPT